MTLNEAREALAAAKADMNSLAMELHRAELTGPQFYGADDERLAGYLASKFSQVGR